MLTTVKAKENQLQQKLEKTQKAEKTAASERREAQKEIDRYLIQRATSTERVQGLKAEITGVKLAIKFNE